MGSAVSPSQEDWAPASPKFRDPYLLTVCPRAMKSGMVTQVGQERVSMGQSHPLYLGGRAPASPKIWNPLRTPKRFDLIKRQKLLW